jgi:hypothetical protein
MNKLDLKGGYTLAVNILGTFMFWGFIMIFLFGGSMNFTMGEGFIIHIIKFFIN